MEHLQIPEDPDFIETDVVLMKDSEGDLEMRFENRTCHDIWGIPAGQVDEFVEKIKKVMEEE